MCHDPDSRPPAPPRPIATVAARESLTLTSADGTDFDAALVIPDRPARVGVVVLPDVRGLHPFYVALADRLAEAGHPAIALDYFARTAERPEGGVRGADFDWKEHIPRTTPEQIDADTAAALAALRERVSPDLPVVAIGFCFGGSQAWRQSTGFLPLAAVAGFYGKPSAVGEGPARRPVLMLIAGDDAATPVADQLALAETLQAAGAPVVTAVYDGAPHSFFDRASTEWAEASADAWRRILALLDRAA